MKILLIESHRGQNSPLQSLLEEGGFAVERADSGGDQGEQAETGVYDLLIVDGTPSRPDCCQLVRQVRRQRSGLPILMLTPRGKVQDRIDGLNAGADCCLAKPVDGRELLAWVAALLRRQVDRTELLRYGNTVLDLSGYLLSTGEGAVRLSKREFDVMRLLMQYQGRSIRKDLLLARVWGCGSGNSGNSVEAYVGFLRKKLAEVGSNLRIRSIRMLGYHLEVEA